MPKKINQKKIIEELRITAKPKLVASVNKVSLSTVYRVMKRTGFSLKLAKHCVHMRDKHNINMRRRLIRKCLLDGEKEMAVANSFGVTPQYINEVKEDILFELKMSLSKMNPTPEFQKLMEKYASEGKRNGHRSSVLRQAERSGAKSKPNTQNS